MPKSSDHRRGDNDPELVGDSWEPGRSVEVVQGTTKYEKIMNSCRIHIITYIGELNNSRTSSYYVNSSPTVNQGIISGKI